MSLFIWIKQKLAILKCNFNLEKEKENISVQDFNVFWFLVIIASID